MAYATPAEKRRYQIEFPKAKLIEKTDLAKYVLTFERKPHIVSRAGQKAFMYFADEVAKTWKSSPTRFNETWYRNACSMALVFGWTDRHVASSEWYKQNRGLKAQTVTYTLALIAQRIIDMGKASINWGTIWNTQDVPDELQQLISSLAPQVAAAIGRTPPNTRNPGEYCKLELCWQTLKSESFDVPDLPDHLMVDHEEEKQEKKDARATAKIDADIDFDVILLSLPPKAEIIRRTAERRGKLSPKGNSALLKLAAGNTNLTRPEKNALKLLLNWMADEGMPWEEL